MLPIAIVVRHVHDELIERNADAVFVEHCFKAFVHFALYGENVALVAQRGELQSNARRA